MNPRLDATGSYALLYQHLLANQLVVAVTPMLPTVVGLTLSGVICMTLILAVSRLTGITLVTIDDKRTHLFETDSGDRGTPFSMGREESSDMMSAGDCPKCGASNGEPYSYCRACGGQLSTPTE